MRTQGFGALASQPVGPSGQLGKEQTLADAEDLVSRYGVGFGQSDSVPHAGTRSVGVELLEYVQNRTAAPLKQFQRLLVWSRKHLRSLRAIHIPGLLNRTADELS